MGLNSRRKGAVGELTLSKYLKSLGFKEARRTQQYSGNQDVVGSADVVCEDLKYVHIECKVWGEAAYHRLDTKSIENACNQAIKDCGDLEWVVMWKCNRTAWYLVTDYDAMRIMVTGDDDIRHLLTLIQEQAEDKR